MSKTKPNQTETKAPETVKEGETIIITTQEPMETVIDPVTTTAPQDIKLLQCEVVKEVVNCEDFKKMIAAVEQCRNMFNDMNSRVQEIENFRNTSSIEGKIRDISEKYDEVLQIVGELRAKLNKPEGK
jgi:hypothetical protein